MPPSFHEDFTPQPPRRGSDRAFGLVFAGVSAVLGIAPQLHGGAVRLWSLGLALLLLGVALLRPKSLGPFNAVWFRFGILLSSITLPLLLAIVFYGVLTPIALLRRLVGAPGLALRREATTSSYWIARKDPPSRGSLKQQF
jgi:hypothetical protein